MHARILGPLEIFVESERVAIRGGNQRELLAILLVHANEVVSPDRLIEDLWGETPPPSALKTLQSLVSRLRANLGVAGESLETHGHGYRLRLEPGHLDADAFGAAVEEGRRALARGNAASAAEILSAALALWRGAALAEFRYESFAQSEIARLEELRLAAQEERVAAELELGRHEELVVELQALVAEEPLRERRRGQLMLALYRAGRQAEALEAYDEGRRALAEELGLEPSEPLQRLQRQILDHDPSLVAPEPATKLRLASKSRRPLLIAAAGALVLAVAAGAAVVQGLRGDEQIPSAGALAFDPESGEVLGRVPLGNAPSRVAIGEGSVWVVDADDRTVSQIDPETRTVTRTFSTSSTPTDIAAGAGAIWIGNAPIGAQSGAAEDWLPASVSRLDAESGLVAATIELPPAPGGHVPGVFPGVSAQHIAAAPDAVWVINRDLTVSRIDPRSNRIVATIDGVKANNVAVGDGEVWVAEGDGVAEIDPGTNSIARRLKLDVPFLSTLAVGGGSVWVTDPEQGNVWRIDTRGELKGTAIPVETWVGGLAFGEGAVWVTNEIADAVHRIDPRTNTVRRIDRATSPRGVDAADGTVWVTSASPPSRDAALPGSVCSGVHFDREGTPDVVVSSSLPLQGPERAVTQSMVAAIKRVLADRRFEAGAFSVGYQSCDSSTAQSGSEDFFRCGSNAKAFARKLNVVGVFGSFFSFCSYLQIPIMNAAPGGPVALISPSNTYDDLTQDDGLYPSGARSFFRLAAPERYLGVAQVELARQLGHERLFLVTSRGEEYSALYLEGLREYAKRVGVEIVGTARFDPEAETFVGISRRVAGSRPQSVAIVGLLTPETGTLIRELRAALGPGVALSTPDAFALPEDLRKLAGAAAEGMYVTTYGIPNDRLPPQGKEFLTSFAAERGGDRGPDLAASYGAQAADILLDAIARSDGTRASVTSEVRSTDIRNGILGDVAFDPKGDLVEGPITVLRVAGGKLVVDRVVLVRPNAGSR